MSHLTKDEVIALALKSNILEPVELLESNQWRYDTVLELERFAHLCRADLVAERDSLQTCVNDWLYANGPDGWINALRAEVERLKARIVDSGVELQALLDAPKTYGSAETRVKRFGIGDLTPRVGNVKMVDMASYCERCGISSDSGLSVCAQCNKD